MRAFPQPAPATVRLTVDEGALVVGLLDFLVEPTMRASPDVIGLAMRTRRRVAAALAGAINESTGGLDPAPWTREEEAGELQRALDVARRVRALVGEAGALILDENDDRLRLLRAELAWLAA